MTSLDLKDAKPSFRPSNNPSGIHQVSERSEANSTKKGHLHPPISGRLAPSGPFKTGGSLTNAGTPYPSASTGLHSEQLQVRTLTDAGVRFCGLSLLPGKVHSSAHPGSLGKALQDTFLSLTRKTTIKACTLMSVISLLASTEKTVKLGMDMRPF